MRSRSPNGPESAARGPAPRDAPGRLEGTARFLARLAARLRRPPTRYPVPGDVLYALETTFGDPHVDRIEVAYRPRYVRCHLAAIGAWHGSVTRPGRIATSLSARAFFASDVHVLHEYYHVVQQWGRERMTRTGYLLRCVAREREAVAFARANVRRYRRLRAEKAQKG